MIFQYLLLAFFTATGYEGECVRNIALHTTPNVPGYQVVVKMSVLLCKCLSLTQTFSNGFCHLQLV